MSTDSDGTVAGGESGPIRVLKDRHPDFGDLAARPHGLSQVMVLDPRQDELVTARVDVDSMDVEVLSGETYVVDKDRDAYRAKALLSLPGVQDHSDILVRDMSVLVDRMQQAVTQGETAAQQLEEGLVRMRETDVGLTADAAMSGGEAAAADGSGGADGSAAAESGGDGGGGPGAGHGDLLDAVREVLELRGAPMQHVHLEVREVDEEPAVVIEDEWQDMSEHHQSDLKNATEPDWCKIDWGETDDGSFYPELKYVPKSVIEAQPEVFG